MTGIFDKATKLEFKDVSEPYYLKFGRPKVKDLPYNIRGGQLTIDGKDLAPLFDPAVESIVDAIEQQKCASPKTIAFVFLVGGFAANNYLFKQLQDLLAPTGVCLSRPDAHFQASSSLY